MNLWDVYYSLVTLPVVGPKYKFYIAIQLDSPKYLLINSEVSSFAKYNSYLKKSCYVEILSSNYDFLDRDSFVCCTDAFTDFEPTDSDRVGSIREDDRVNIIKAVIYCDNLVIGDKKQIIHTHTQIARPIIANMRP